MAIFTSFLLHLIWTTSRCSVAGSHFVEAENLDNMELSIAKK